MYDAAHPARRPQTATLSKFERRCSSSRNFGQPGVHKTAAIWHRQLAAANIASFPPPPPPHANHWQQLRTLRATYIYTYHNHHQLRTNSSEQHATHGKARRATYTSKYTTSITSLARAAAQQHATHGKAPSPLARTGSRPSPAGPPSPDPRPPPRRPQPRWPTSVLRKQDHLPPPPSKPPPLTLRRWLSLRAASVPLALLAVMTAACW